MRKGICKSVATLSILLGPLVSTVYADDTNGLLLFGDSLFDTGAGNAVATAAGVPLPSPTPPYFDGRHSNGPIWIDYTSQQLGLPFTDYAVSGSETGALNFNNNVLGGLFQQVQRFAVTSGRVPSDTIVLMDGGGNDFLALLNLLPNLTPADFTNAATQAVTNVTSVFLELQSLGAKQIVMWTLPDLGKIPLFTNPNFPPLGPLGPVLAPAFSQVSAGYNQGLIEVASALNGATGTKQIFIFDAAAVFNDLEQQLTAQGIDITEFAFLANYGGPYIPTGNNPDYLAFFDQVHPTTLVWKLFGDTMSAYIDTLITGPRFIAAEVDLALETSKAHRDLVENHFRTLNVERYIYNESDWNDCCACDCECVENRFQLYIDGEGKWGSAKNKRGSLGFKYDTGLGLLGFDYRATCDFTVGASFAAQESRAHIRGKRGRMKLDDYISTLYAAYFGPCYFVDFAANYHYYQFKGIKRQIPFLNRVAKGKTNGQGGEFNLEAGYVAQRDCFTMIPILGLDVERVSIEGYKEHGAGLVNLRTKRQHQTSCIGKLGGQVFWNGLSEYLLPFGELFYEYEFARKGRLMYASFVDSLDGAKDFNRTSSPNRNGLKYSVGLESRMCSNIVGNVSYVGETDFDRCNNAVRAQIDFAF